MQKAGFDDNNSYYKTLKGYLDKLALGIAKRQDEKSGCWYQLIGKDGNYSARYYNGDDKGEIKNYLESSCTAIFAAAFLKATRLELLSSATDGTKTYNYKDIGINAYKGVVTQFMKQREDGTVDLLGCCKSAGLGTNALGHEKFRDGSNAYYLHGHDVAPTSKTSNNYTEGKVLGAFIMAATEYERKYQHSTLLSKDLNKTYNLGSNESLTVEVLGDGEPEYQWYNATESTPSPIEGAKGESYTPTQSGKYYCEITVTPTPTSAAAKTRDASTNGSYTIKTSTADVNVAAAATTYTVTFNAGSYGTSSKSSMQVSAGNSITLPSVSANSGYTFDGWYDAETGGTKIGDADQTYTPESDITLYARYTATGGSGGSADPELVTFDYSKNEALANWTSGVITVDGSNGKISSSQLQFDSYATKSLSIKSSTDVVITKIVFTYSKTSNLIQQSNLTAPKSDYTVSETTGTWVGSQSVSSGHPFTWTWNTDKPRFTKIEITYTTGTPSTPTTHTVTATAENGNGNVTITDSNGKTITSGSEVEHGKSLTFTATANEGFEFSGWTVTGTKGTADGATYTITSLEAETAVTATFTETSSGGGNNDQPIYKYQVSKAGITAPGINTSKYITTENDETGKTGEILVKMTFGGWRWNEGTYTRPETGKPVTDSWKDSETVSGVTDLEGYQYWFSGPQDAKHEKKDSVMMMYGQPRKGWFVSPTRTDGITTESHPYTLPVRGSFMTFEPTMNGTLTIYILQNGV